MVEDRSVLLAGPDAAALTALQSIGQGVLIGALGHADALDADGQAGGVHHHEHMGQALVRTADQFGAGAFIGHDAGGRGVDAQLVLDADRVEGVAFAQRAVGVDRELGRQEQADALGPSRGVGQASQHQVDDVVRGVVVAPGDEDLLAAQGIGAIAKGRGRGGQGAQIRTGVRLGQHHGAGPFAADQLGQVGGLLVLGADGFQRLDGGQRQHGAKAERHVGGVDGFIGRQLQRLGQGLAAGLDRGGQAGPAAFGELFVGVDEAGGGGDGAVGVFGACQIAWAVQRGQDLFRELACGLQHRAHDVGVVVGECARGGDLINAGDGFQGEGEVTDGGAVAHGDLQNLQTASDARGVEDARALGLWSRFRHSVA